MKKILQLLFFICTSFVFGQEVNYTGEYGFGSSLEEGRTGYAYIYPETDSTFIVYLELSRGAPSYNSGAIIGQLIINASGHASVTQIEQENFLNCSLNFSLEDSTLIISTAEGLGDCGFGYGVFADAKYIKKSDTIPEYFIDRTGKKTFFKDLLWKEWSE